MAKNKRFTDTDKWKRESFRTLSPKAKCAWLYLCDQCDHCGIWIADFGLATFQLGFALTPEDLTNWFGDKVRKIEDNRYFMTTFFDFQYGDSKDSFTAKKSALARLIKMGLMTEEGTVVPVSPQTQGLSPQSPPTLVPVSMETTVVVVGVVEGEVVVDPKSASGKKTEPRELDIFEKLYKELYPRREGKDDGLKRIRAQAGRDPSVFQDFPVALQHYAAVIERRKPDPDKIKMFSTFVGNDKDKVYPWRDFIERPRELDIVSANKNAPLTGVALVEQTLKEMQEYKANRAVQLQIAGLKS